MITAASKRSATAAAMVMPSTPGNGCRYGGGAAGMTTCASTPRARRASARARLESDGVAVGTLVRRDDHAARGGEAGDDRGEGRIRNGDGHRQGRVAGGWSAGGCRAGVR